MNEDARAAMNEDARAESADEVFARIQRRRRSAPARALAPKVAPSPAPDLVPMTANTARQAVDDGDRFPRSATMKLALRHPLATLAVALPAVALLARSASSRRLIGTALSLIAQPELVRLAGLSAEAAKRLTHREE